MVKWDVGPHKMKRRVDMCGRTVYFVCFVCFFSNNIDVMKKRSIQGSIFHDEKDKAQAFILHIVYFREKEASGGCFLFSHRSL